MKMTHHQLAVDTASDLNTNKTTSNNATKGDRNENFDHE